jgi:glucose-6-phosphate isomerase
LILWYILYNKSLESAKEKIQMTNIQNNFNSKIDKRLFDCIKDEIDDIGYYSLVDQNLSKIEEYAKNVNKKDIVVVGIGGSSLGTFAIYQFLKAKYKFEKRLFFLESTDPVVLNDRINEIDLNDALFIVVSKSGTTIETISILKYILSLEPINDDNYVVITDEGSVLEKFAIKNSINTFLIPSNVGGRFSVFSAVGLLPLAIIGVDIKNLLKGAKTLKNDFFDTNSKTHNDLIAKATYYGQHTNKFNINCIFSYSELLRGFNSWYIQLWGESLGKQQLNSSIHIGLTPIGLIGPTDQHSFLQLIVDGKRDKSVTFIKINNFEVDIKVPNISLEYIENLDIVNDINFSELINLQADSVIESLQDKTDIPLDIITIDKINEESISKLMFYYEILTSLVSKVINVNAYDQPAVEESKKILKNKLSKY